MARCGNSCELNTTSKLEAANGSPASRSATSKRTLASCCAAATAVAVSSSSADRSTPTTDPLGTSPASPAVIVPGPQPTSRMASVGRRCGVRKAASEAAVRDACDETVASGVSLCIVCGGVLGHGSSACSLSLVSVSM